MSNPSGHKSQQSSKKKPNLAPEAMQGTDDSQSEFSVNASREERREEDKKADELNASSADDNETNAAETQSEFSINERLRGNS